MVSVDRKLMYAIFDYSQIHTSSSLRSSLALLSDPKNMSIAVGISWLSSIEAEILRYCICNSGDAWRHTLIYHLPRCQTVFTLVPLSCWKPKMWVQPLYRCYLVYKLRYKYFRFSGRHLGFLVSGYINQHGWEQNLLAHSLSYVLQMFVVEQYAFDKRLRAVPRWKQEFTEYCRKLIRTS